MISWLFLLVSLWGALWTFNALSPRLGGARISGVSFLAGWLTSELAVHHLAWQALATLVFGLAGAFDAWPGLLGLAITVVSWVGLCLAQLRAVKAAGVVESALSEGLGTGYRSGIAPELAERLADRIDWRRVVSPFPMRRPGVDRIRNIVYGRARGIDLKLDVYHPREAGRGRPMLLQVHGGAWVMGSKNEQALPLMYQLASNGWVCVTADYRLSPHATFPEHLIDLKRALVWMKEHAREYGGDPDFVIVTGGSAGGHLCSLLALTQNDPAYQPGFEEKDTSVQGCVPFYGVYDFLDRGKIWRHSGLLDLVERQILKGSRDEIPELWEEASPLSRVNAGAPPFFVIHGDRDSLAPVGEARAFVKALREKSRQPVLYAEIPGAQHAFELFPSVRSLRVNAAVERFLAVLRSRHLAARRGEAGARDAEETERQGEVAAAEALGSEAARVLH